MMSFRYDSAVSEAVSGSRARSSENLKSSRRHGPVVVEAQVIAKGERVHGAVGADRPLLSHVRRHFESLVEHHEARKHLDDELRRRHVAGDGGVEIRRVAGQQAQLAAAGHRRGLSRIPRRLRSRLLFLVDDQDLAAGESQGGDERRSQDEPTM